MEQKTPEQIAAELKLQADARAAAEQAAAEREAELKARKEKAGELHFVYEGEVYKPLMPRVNIPGLGSRTALEICVDEEAQAFLVKERCVGSVIELV